MSSFFCEGGAAGGAGATTARSNAQRDHSWRRAAVAAPAGERWTKWKNQGGPSGGFDTKYVVAGVFREDLCEADLKQQYDNQIQQNPIGNDTGVDGDVQSRTPKKVSVGSAAATS